MQKLFTLKSFNAIVNQFDGQSILSFNMTEFSVKPEKSETFENILNNTVRIRPILYCS